MSVLVILNIINSKLPLSIDKIPNYFIFFDDISKMTFLNTLIVTTELDKTVIINSI